MSLSLFEFDEVFALMTRVFRSVRDSSFRNSSSALTSDESILLMYLPHPRSKKRSVPRTLFAAIQYRHKRALLAQSQFWALQDVRGKSITITVLYLGLTALPRPRY
jgi:hypothetical protein